jgi:ADP-ribose diphosphatase
LETKVSSEEIFSGRLLHVRRDVVRLEDGRERIREWIDHPGASAVVPVLPDGRVVMVRQYRYGPGRSFLEIPAGKFDGTFEDADSVARRELEEETGYCAGRLTRLGSLYNAIGYSNEIIHLFLATDLSLRSQNLDEDEVLSVELHPFSDLVVQARSGALQDMKTVSALLMAEAVLNRE